MDLPLSLEDALGDGLRREIAIIEALLHQATVDLRRQLE